MRENLFLSPVRMAFCCHSLRSCCNGMGSVTLAILSSWFSLSLQRSIMKKRSIGSSERMVLRSTSKPLSSIASKSRRSAVFQLLSWARSRSTSMKSGSKSTLSSRLPMYARLPSESSKAFWTRPTWHNQHCNCGQGMFDSVFETYQRGAQSHLVLDERYFPQPSERTVPIDLVILHHRCLLCDLLSSRGWRVYLEGFGSQHGVGLPYFLVHVILPVSGPVILFWLGPDLNDRLIEIGSAGNMADLDSAVLETAQLLFVFGRFELHQRPICAELFSHSGCRVYRHCTSQETLQSTCQISR